ncbi:aromatic-L-amino-acid decarboxylase [Leucosporidium creatinivorum]|uniref:Aromatic-L-amino-acid decarboxylase n=1 Tax=Leucosporidium creatinivorum TaxID=106004 RepID=A0A1Y2EW21_9BASI|nr:aromatic-L-amino-acid decarboxylase [Leucosporidium creatinivorum]
MDREQFRKAGYAAIDRICDYFEELPERDVMPSVEPGDIGRQIPKSAPVEGEEWSTIAADFDKVILPGITHWQAPMFMAYFPANTTYESILADIYAGAVSNPGFNWLCSPACTELEVVQMDWVAQLLGLDESFHNASNVGGGIIMGSASESCLTVCIAARERALRLHPGTPFEQMVIVGTTQTHSLGAKAALILGLSFEAIETKEEDAWALRGEALRETLGRLKGEGKLPFALLATVGSTSTGAIDDIAEITAVAASYPELFIHVDAAWAGVMLALPEAREECHLDAINARSTAVNAAGGICASGEVHSFCTNLHKSGLVTFDASCLWVRDRKLLTEALDITPPFLRNKHTDTGLVVDYRNWQISLGRRFRSLKLYFVLRSYGISGFQAHLRNLISRAARLESLVLSSPNEFELFVPRRFSLVVLRLKASSPKNGEVEDKDANELNKKFFALTAERKDIHLTPTTVGGKYCTRIAIGSPFTKDEHIKKVWKVINELAEEAKGSQVEGK